MRAVNNDFSGKNLRNTSFKNADLPNALFLKSDLRGADFSGANLAGAKFEGAKTGITPLYTVLIFIAVLGVSLLSGYIAMLTGQLIQSMIQSPKQNVCIAGYLSAVIITVFAVFSTWRGVGYAVRQLIAPVLLSAMALVAIGYLTGLGDGHAMRYLILSLVLIVAMFVVGTVARALAGSLSVLIFWVVAVLGSVYGRSLGGGIGTVVMAIACAQISKRALNGDHGFEVLKNMALSMTAKFGTSFRNAKLDNADFSHAILRNADFTNARTPLVRWGNSKKINCKK